LQQKGKRQARAIYCRHILMQFLFIGTALAHEKARNPLPAFSDMHKKTRQTNTASPSASTHFFRLKPLVLVVTAAAMLGSVQAQAQEKSTTDLQTEVQRLRQALESAERALQQKQGGATPTAASPAETGSTTAKASDEPVALGDVVIRTRNRLEKVQDVPISVSVVSGTELEREGASDIKDLVKRAANISWGYGNQRTSSLSLRGIGRQGQTEAMDPSVGVVVDGVPLAYNALVSSYNFNDLDTLEVARGPQGTLLGKNTSLGVVNITSKRPSFTPSADYSLTLGQRDTVIGKFAAGGPLVDDLLAWRGSFVSERSNGYLTNLQNKDQTYGNTNRLSGRVQFLLTPSSDFDARLSLEVTPRTGEYTNGVTIYKPTPTTYPNGTATNLSTDASTRLGRSWFLQRNPSYSYADTYLYGAGGNYVDLNGQYPLVTGGRAGSLELNKRLDNGFTVTAITGYRDYYFDAVNDEGTPFDVQSNSGGYKNSYRQFSQELRLSSPTGGLVDYQTGLFLFGSKTNANYQKGWGADGGAWFANASQYNTLYGNATGALLGSGTNLLINSLSGLRTSGSSTAGLQDIENRSIATYGQANWHLDERTTLTTGLRFTLEHRTNEGSSGVTDNGAGASLNPVSVNGVQLGGFASDASGNLTGANSATQLALANSVAQQYFGVSNYSSLSNAQKAQVAAAKAIRLSQLGVLYNNTRAESFNKIQPNFTIAPSYKLNDHQTAYVSLQYGEKAGISQLVNGASSLVKPERNTSFEVGLKSALLDKTLLINADVYLTKIRDYQQSVQVYDAYTTGLNNNGITYYTAATGNVPKVESTGLEIDGAYNGIRNLQIRFAGAYTRAVYKDFPNAAKPNELGYLSASYVDMTGQLLPGASRVTLNLGAEYRRQIQLFGDKSFHASFNTNYFSRNNTSSTLSSYGWVPDSTTTDFSIGLGKIDKSADVSLLVKNAFENKTPQSATWNSYNPTAPRWIGIVYSGKLY
jgi:outer membrane receptor protein involved in Fe transport